LKTTRNAFALLLLLTVVGYGLYRKNLAPNSAEAESVEAPVKKKVSRKHRMKREVKTEIEVANASAAEAAADPATTSNDSETPLNDLVPSTEELRAEVANDPHLPPPSLMKFAEVMGKYLEQAEQSEDAAANFVGELDECLRDEEHPEPIRALCLASANRLSNKFEVLKPRTAEMANAAGDHLTELAR
jgi:hypothetical protein